MANTLSSNLLQLISKISNILIIGIGASSYWKKMTLGELIAFRIISGYVTANAKASFYGKFSRNVSHRELVTLLINPWKSQRRRREHSYALNQRNILLIL